MTLGRYMKSSHEMEVKGLFRNWRSWLSNDRDRLRKFVGLVNDKHRVISALTDDELQAEASELRQMVQTGGRTDRLRVKAFALVKEAVSRKLGIVMHDEQIMGAWVMADGQVAEMKTGEGKTIASLPPLFWLSLQNQVHMITVNDYLAQRDYVQADKVMAVLGTSVGWNHAALSGLQKKEVYAKEIVYGTWSEFGFDFLRDRMEYQIDRRVMPGFNYAVIDEIDSVLIDEAKTPIIIAGKSRASPDLYYLSDKLLRALTNRDYEVDEETQQVMFTEAGIRKIEAMFMIDNLFDISCVTIYHHLLQCLRARVIMQADRDYIVDKGKVQIIDAFTGRIMDGREFSDGLQQAIEMKENVPLSEETRAHASITVQKFFSLYPFISGMTGTMESDKEEMREIYGLHVFRIPTHKPVLRKDLIDRVFLTKRDKYRGLASEVSSLHERGIPVLVGTTSISQSQEIYELLRGMSLPCQILNAKTEREEAEIIGRAGRRGAITIATNMAGRGADIHLDPEVISLGGLHVLGTERHESRRIDLQLRGRSGRQGLPGASRFFISLEDDLIRRFGGEEAETVAIGWRTGEEGSSDVELVRWVDAVQERAERHMYEVRLFVYRLDCVVHKQRQWYYEYREKLFSLGNVTDELLASAKYVFAEKVAAYCPENDVFEEWQTDRLRSELGWGEPIRLSGGVTQQDVLDQIKQTWEQHWFSFQYRLVSPLWSEEWRLELMKLLDRGWLEHMESLNALKLGIHFRALEKRDPLDIYEEESFVLFQMFERQFRLEAGGKFIREVLDFCNRKLRGSA
ncbi:accessory Sec system translocase SecA2 [Paenibacillus chartarius]|uniref:Protein translocase subunit SecA n=1 Tax=Paenibacillus chartarius TaxID=747481 RepID=A0ABV6DJC9_9BACL